MADLIADLDIELAAGGSALVVDEIEMLRLAAPMISTYWPNNKRVLSPAVPRVYNSMAKTRDLRAALSLVFLASLSCG